MKYLFKSFILVIWLVIGIQAIGQTNLGSWVISTNPTDVQLDPCQNSTDHLIELQFSTSGITATFLSTTNGVPDKNACVSSTSSGYFPDKSLACYTFTNTGSISFFNSNKEFKIAHSWADMDHTSRVVSLPGDPTKFCAVYTSN